MCWRCVEGLGGEGEKQTKKKGGREEKKNQLERLTSVGRIGQLQLEGFGASLPTLRCGRPAKKKQRKHLKRHKTGGGRGGGKPRPHSPDRVTRGQAGGGHDEKMPAGDAHSPSGIIPECF